MGLNDFSVNLMEASYRSGKFEVDGRSAAVPSIFDVAGNLLTLAQARKPGPLDSAGMDESVLAAVIWRDEAKTFGVLLNLTVPLIMSWSFKAPANGQGLLPSRNMQWGINVRKIGGSPSNRLCRGDQVALEAENVLQHMGMQCAFSKGRHANSAFPEKSAIMNDIRPTSARVL